MNRIQAACGHDVPAVGKCEASLCWDCECEEYAANHLAAIATDKHDSSLAECNGWTPACGQTPEAYVEAIWPPDLIPF